MALILSGHGLRIQGQGFNVPHGMTVNFITREGISVRDGVAGRVEANPDGLDKNMVVNRYTGLCPDYYLIDPWTPPANLTINACPPGHFQFIPQNGEVYELSSLLHQAMILAMPKPLSVIWCACRAIEAHPSWEESLRRHR